MSTIPRPSTSTDVTDYVPIETLLKNIKDYIITLKKVNSTPAWSVWNEGHQEKVERLHSGHVMDETKRLSNLQHTIEDKHVIMVKDLSELKEEI